MILPKDPLWVFNIFLFNFILQSTNIFNSIFKHIRNSIAHSRWQLKDNIYYFEDGSFKKIEDSAKEVFCVTARIVLSRESLIKWRDIINNGPSTQELQKIELENTLSCLIENIKEIYANRSFRKSEIIKQFNIDNSLWNKLYRKGKENGIFKFKNGRWSIITNKI